MADQNNETNTQTNVMTHTTADGTVEVLYQKMGSRWFAFSLVNDEVFVGSISQEEIDGSEKNPLHRITGNT
jgi:hypothetical protein